MKNAGCHPGNRHRHMPGPMDAVSFKKASILKSMLKMKCQNFPCAGWYNC